MTNPPEAAARPARNIRLTLAYDGSAFHGWQVQPSARTVQEELERAIARLTGNPVRVSGSGRTDAGVHALGQVANFSYCGSIPDDRWPAALASVLPPDIRVLTSDVVDDAFHARFSAKQKTYRYVIVNEPPFFPQLRNYTLFREDRLDVARMRSAARELVGTRDFRSFTSQAGADQNTTRTVTQATWGRDFGECLWRAEPIGEAVADDGEQGDPEAPFLWFEITANGFLYNMVRSIVGTLLRVGNGQLQVAEVREILARRDRSGAWETAPPQGLYLVQVSYSDTVAT